MSIAAPTAPTSAAFQFLSELVYRKSAIVLDETKTYLVDSRLLPIARENGHTSLEGLVEQLKKPGSMFLIEEVVDAMTTNESSFFRDIKPFNLLEKEILPQMIKSRGDSKALNIWSNACSSGQEVYSIAMMIRDKFPELNDWQVHLTATDLSQVILDKARSGLFTQTEMNRGLPMPMVLKYFEREGMNWKIGDTIRNMVDFSQVNLIEAWPSKLPKMDVVFLRNVLIYFDVETKQQILRKLRRNMADDGVLFLGGSENTMNLDVPFERKAFDRVAVYVAN